MRKSRTSIEVQAIYYIMEGVIYQTPTVQKLIKSRLNKFTHHLNNAFGETYDTGIIYSTTEGLPTNCECVGYSVVYLVRLTVQDT